jgi:hypothetical protein
MLDNEISWFIYGEKALSQDYIWYILLDHNYRKTKFYYRRISCFDKSYTEVDGIRQQLLN